MSTPANIGQVLRATQKAVAAQTANRDAAAAAAAAAPVSVPPVVAQGQAQPAAEVAGHG